MRPSNWDRPRFGQGEWGQGRFDMSFQDLGEDNKRQPNSFGIFRTGQRTTDPPNIVGQIPGQIGRNRGFGQRGESGNDKQPLPPSLPPMPVDPQQNPSTPQIPMSTQPPTQREATTTPIPQPPVTQAREESEENFGGFGESEISSLPPPPVTINPNQIGQRRTAIPGSMRGFGQGGFSPPRQPGVGQVPAETPEEQLRLPERFGSFEESGAASSPQPSIDPNRRQQGFEQRIPEQMSANEQNQDDTRMTPAQYWNGKGQNQMAQRKGTNSESQKPPVNQNQKKTGTKQETGQTRNVGGGLRQNTPLNRDSKVAIALGAAKQKYPPTQPRPSVGQDQNQTGQRRTGPVGNRAIGQQVPPSNGQRPIYPGTPRQNKQPENRIGDPRYNEPQKVTQASSTQMPRQQEQGRNTGRNGARGRNIPNPQRYPPQQNPREVEDAEVITSPTFFIQNRDRPERPTPPRPPVNRRPGQGGGEQGDLDGMETNTRNVPRPPRG